MPRSDRSMIVTLRVGVTERITQKHAKELKNRPVDTNKDTGGYVNDLLEYILDKDEFLKVYAPSISLIGIQDNVIFLKDNNLKNNIIEIYLKDRELYCQYDKKQDCKHIKYAFAIPEIAKLNLKF